MFRQCQKHCDNIKNMQEGAQQIPPFNNYIREKRRQIKRKSTNIAFVI